MDYISDEQRVEELKQWWKENWTSILTGVMLGVGGLLGWRGWVYYHENQAKAASEVFQSIVVAASRQDVKTIEDKAILLEDNYASTPYAALGALQLAKFKARKGDLDTTAGQLLWVIENASQNTVRDVAKLRLARVYVVQRKFDEALKLLSDLPVSYYSLVEEIRGDVLVAKGQIAAAREAYDRALLSGGKDSSYLRMKRDDLGDTPKAAPKAAPKEIINKEDS